MEEKIKVFIKLNDKAEIIDINSDVFVKNPSGWIKINEGFGDKFAHAQSHYLPSPIMDDFGNYSFRYTGGQIMTNRKQGR